MSESCDPAEWFALGPDVIASLAAATATVEHHAALSAWREQFAGAMAAALGQPSEQPELARLAGDAITALPDADHRLRQHLPLVALADALPAAVGYLRDRGIDDDVIRASLADVGRTETKNRAWFADEGLGAELAIWLNRHLYGAIYQLGRLQFERVELGELLAQAIRDGGGEADATEVAVNLHIPGGLGPMTPEAIDESLAMADVFFAKHFDDEPHRFTMCGSWLLDPQLTEYLPESSNIVSFQRRFSIAPLARADADKNVGVRRFVFGEARTPLADQPRSSTLERAIHAHIGAGRRFVSRAGWFRFPNG